jgi:neutral ceramidase
LDVWVRVAIVDVIGQATGKLELSRASYGVGCSHVALNRQVRSTSGIKLGKNNSGPIDVSEPILRIQNASGKTLAVLLGDGCHNTTHRPDMMRIDPVYAGFAEDQTRTSDLRPTLEGGYAPFEPRTDARGHGC